MKLTKQLKNIKKKGLSEILFMAFATMMILITILLAFR
jgi:hypothetical protein